jgi:hypothetical protein
MRCEDETRTKPPNALEVKYGASVLRHRSVALWLNTQVGPGRGYDLWGQIDKAMDAFIKPVQGKSPDPAKVQTAYDTFIAKLQLAVKSDAEPKR